MSCKVMSHSRELSTATSMFTGQLGEVDFHNEKHVVIKLDDRLFSLTEPTINWSMKQSPLVMVLPDDAEVVYSYCD